MFSLTPDRLTAAKEVISDLMDPNGCLKIVIDSRLAAKGFSPDEVIAALDMIGRERQIHVRRLKHPKLQGRLVFSFSPIGQ